MQLKLQREDAGPSRASKRILVAASALLGVAIAGRLTAYQIGWTGAPWEPFFGTGTERVLHSSFSRALPFPDAALGLLMYIAEIAALAWGDTARWRSKPVAVYVYVATAFGLAGGSLGLLVLQAAVIHAFCTLCLASALLSFVLVAPAALELAAALKAHGAEK